MSAPRRAVTITCVHRDPDGYWRARVSAGGVTLNVHRRYGSWLAEVRPRPGVRHVELREVLPHVAAALQARVRPLERRLPSDARPAR